MDHFAFARVINENTHICSSALNISKFHSPTQQLTSDFTHPRSESLFRAADVHIVHDSAPERHILRRRFGCDPPRAHEAHLEWQVPQTSDNFLVEEAPQEFVIHL